jgi:hypothetical protein
MRNGRAGNDTFDGGARTDDLSRGIGDDCRVSNAGRDHGNSGNSDIAFNNGSTATTYNGLIKTILTPAWPFRSSTTRWDLVLKR